MNTDFNSKKIQKFVRLLRGTEYKKQKSHVKSIIQKSGQAQDYLSV